MAIPASHIVNISPRVITGGSNDLELNGLLLTKNNIISAASMVLSFTSIAAVGVYFGIDSVEYAAADVYFTSYDNKFTTPRAFFVARRVDEDVPAWLRGAGNIRTISQFKTITDGAFVISVDNVATTVGGVDLSAATSYSDVAVAIQAALVTAGATGAVVDYSSLTQAFTITSGTAGTASEVGYAAAPTAGTDLAAFMGFRQEDGAVLSPGMAALSQDEQMAAVLSQTQNWVCFTTAWECELEEAAAWDAWTPYGWLYVGWTTSPTAPSPDSSADVASMIKEAGGGVRMAPVYGNSEIQARDTAILILSITAAISWQRTGGAITFAFKKQSGIAAGVVDENAANTLEAKGYNYVGNFATRNSEFIFLFPGQLLNSDYNFIDSYVNSIWLNNRLQVALMDGISQSSRSPYTDRGYNMIRAWMLDPNLEALNNGVIEPGVVLSERQKSELFNEAGRDISNELWTQGYYIQIIDPGTPVRSKRESPIINEWYTYGGAVHKLDVASTAIL